MKKNFLILSIIISIMLVGLGSADIFSMWKNVAYTGNSIVDSGTISAEQLTSTDDGTIAGDLSVTGTITSGTSVVNGKISDALWIDNLLRVTGVSYLNTTVIAGISYQNRTKATQLEASGNTYLNGTTIHTGDTLAVTSADKLTVNSVIVPTEIPVPIQLIATSANSSFFIAKGAWKVTRIVSSITSVSTYNTGNNSCKITKVTGSAIATGDNPSCLLAGSSINLKGSIGTATVATLNATAGSYTLADGERLAIKFNNGMTGLVGSLTVYVTRV